MMIWTDGIAVKECSGIQTMPLAFPDLREPSLYVVAGAALIDNWIYFITESDHVDRRTWSHEGIFVVWAAINEK